MHNQVLFRSVLKALGHRPEQQDRQGVTSWSIAPRLLPIARTSVCLRLSAPLGMFNRRITTYTADSGEPTGFAPGA